MANDRRKSEAAGRSAELMALWALRLKGWRLLARRYRTPVGEVDLKVRAGAGHPSIQHGQGVVADIGLEHMAPYGAHLAVCSLCGGDTAAFAAVVGQSRVVAKTAAAIRRYVVIDCRAFISRLIAAMRGPGALGIALVDPEGVQVAARIEHDGFETVRDHLPILMHGERRGEARAAVIGTQHADLAGVGLGQRPRVADRDLPGRADRLVSRCRSPGTA